jgi:hypothetical protein
MSVQDLAVTRLEAIIIAAQQEIEAVRKASATTKAAGAVSTSLLNLDYAAAQAREHVARFDATIEDLIVRMKSAAAASVTVVPTVTGAPGPVGNVSNADREIMTLANDLKNSLLARARAAFQLGQLEAKLAESRPAPAYTASAEGEPEAA